jgi:hypothetical protein
MLENKPKTLFVTEVFIKLLKFKIFSTGQEMRKGTHIILKSLSS